MKDCFLLHKCVDTILSNPCLTSGFSNPPVQVTVNFKPICGQGGSACGGMLNYLLPTPSCRFLCSGAMQCAHSGMPPLR